jgi:hypothetical protein
MRRNSHVRFGGRAEETDRPKGQHRASARSNHTAATLAARTGASTKELVARLGHASPGAALIYQHATEERDRANADALNTLIQGASDTVTDRDARISMGTQWARRPPEDLSEGVPGDEQCL